MCLNPHDQGQSSFSISLKGKFGKMQSRKIWVMGPAGIWSCPQGPTCTGGYPRPGHPDSIRCRIGGKLILNLHKSPGQWWLDCKILEPSCTSSCHTPDSAQVLNLSGPSVSHSQWLPLSLYLLLKGLCKWALLGH